MKFKKKSKCQRKQLRHAEARRRHLLHLKVLFMTTYFFVHLKYPMTYIKDCSKETISSVSTGTEPATIRSPSQYRPNRGYYFSHLVSLTTAA